MMFKRYQKRIEFLEKESFMNTMLIYELRGNLMLVCKNMGYEYEEIGNQPYDFSATVKNRKEHDSSREQDTEEEPREENHL